MSRRDDLAIEIDSDRARRILKYLHKAEAFGEDRDTQEAAQELRESLRTALLETKGEMPDKIGSVVLAPLNEGSDDYVEWVYAGWYSTWHHKTIERDWDNLDVVRIERVGTDVSDETYMMRRVKSSIGLLMELHGHSYAPDRNKHETELLQSVYGGLTQFYEEMIAERDPGYRKRFPERRRGDEKPIEMGTETPAEASEVGA